MAGAKGRSGGARPGAGRKNEPAKLPLADATPEPGAPGGPEFRTGTYFHDPRQFLLTVMKHPMVEAKLRVEADKNLMPFEHAKKGKAAKTKSATPAPSGKFGRREPPKLAASGGRIA